VSRHRDRRRPAAWCATWRRRSATPTRTWRNCRRPRRAEVSSARTLARL
jgi:hypothetical protein